MTIEFYAKFAPFYHLLYADWEQSMEHQAAQLDQLIQENWGNEVRTILDVSCGVGAQVARAKYYAVGITRLLALLAEAGFENLKRVDGVLSHPVLVGTRRK